MGFDIPMNTKGCLSADSLLALNGGGQQTQQPTMNQAPAQSMNFNQQQVLNQQQNINSQQMNMQAQYQQPVQQQPQQMQQQPIQQKQRPQGNGVHLKKGQKFALAGAGQQLGTIKFCLGWDVLNQACDLDASAFMLGQDGRVIGDDWFVFYGQTNSPDNSIIHSGDSTGEGVGDDEIITVNTQQVNPNIQKVAFVVTINEALERNLNFSMVSNAYVRVVDCNTNNEIARFELTDYYANVTSMVVGELYRHNGTWKFNAVGDGVAKDLAGLCAMYGVNVAD